MKVVFIGAGSGFGARTVVDLMSFPELRDCELVLVDINPDHLRPVLEYAQKVAVAVGADSAKIRGELGWRDGVLEGADYVITAFSQGGPGYNGVPYYYEINVPREHGIEQRVADTVGIGGVFRVMRTAPELLAIAQDMEKRCPGAWLLNYVNPMSMLTRIICKACPSITMLGLCHNIQYGIRDLANWLKVPYKSLRYECAGINHMDWFLRLEYLDGRSAYGDLLKAIEDPAIYQKRPVQFELLKSFGYFTTESSGHLAEYLPYFLPRERDRLQFFKDARNPERIAPPTQPRWNPDAPLVKELHGEQPLNLKRSFEYGAHIIHAHETDTVYRMHINVMNEQLIDNFSRETCVEVESIVDRMGLHPLRYGSMPIELAALCSNMANMQTLGSDAFLEKDLHKAYLACVIDSCTAASATPATIKTCFNQLLELEKPYLKDYWGDVAPI